MPNALPKKTTKNLTDYAVAQARKEANRRFDRYDDTFRVAPFSREISTRYLYDEFEEWCNQNIVVVVDALKETGHGDQDELQDLYATSREAAWHEYAKTYNDTWDAKHPVREDYENYPSSGRGRGDSEDFHADG